MQYLMDLIAAFLIGASLLLIIFTMMLRGQEVSIGATQHAAAKKGMLALAEIIEQDFNNIGAGVATPDTSLIRLDTAGAGPHAFVFWGRVVRDSTEARRVCYRWAPSDTLWVSEQGVLTQKAAYQIERRVNVTNPNDCTTGTLSGLSMGTVTRFRVDLRHGATGGPVAVPGPIDPDVGARILVTVTAVSPLGLSEVIEQTEWSASFAPVNLRRNSD